MRVEKDYEELLRLFNKYKVRYCVVGAYAVALYARPRYTKDMDILVEPDIENGQRIIKALDEFGFGKTDLAADDFSRKYKIIQLGYEPIRVDIVTSIEGVNFKQVWRNKEISQYGRQKVFFIGIDELIKAKKSSNRKQDRIDADILIRAKKSRDCKLSA